MAKAKKKTAKKPAPAKAAKTSAKKAPVKKTVKAKGKKPAPAKAAKKAVKKAAVKAGKPAVSAKAPVSTAKTARQQLSSRALQPLDNRIVVEPASAEKTTASGLILPDVADVSGNLKGRVIAVGRGHLDKKGRLHPIELKVGDEVLYAPYAGSKISWNGQDLIVVRENDILGIVET